MPVHTKAVYYKEPPDKPVIFEPLITTSHMRMFVGCSYGNRRSERNESMYMAGGTLCKALHHARSTTYTTLAIP